MSSIHHPARPTHQHQRLPSLSPSELLSPPSHDAFAPASETDPDRERETSPTDAHEQVQRWKKSAASTAQLVVDEEDDSGTIIGNGNGVKKWKGKGRATGENPAMDVDLENGGMEHEELEMDGTGGTYPPVSDDALEERKIAENLKRWEQAERKRRKSLREARSARDRESSASLADVTRRASLLFRPGQRRGRQLAGGGAGDRSSTQSSASDAPLHPADAELGMRSPSPMTPGHAPSLSTSSQTTTTSQHTVRNLNSSSSSNPFSSAPSSPSNLRTRPRPPDPEPDPFSSRSSLSERALPALPEEEPPESSMPFDMDPRWRRDMETDGSSELKDVMDAESTEGERHRRRWWIDWLCGCGGDETDDEDQAGRTNPFE